MKLPLLFTVIFFSALQVLAQNSIHMDLKRQLDSIWESDQKYREILSHGASDSVGVDSMSKSLHIPPAQVIGTLWKLQNAIDSSNLVFVEAILGEYGYPGKTLVGSPTDEAAWAVIQHSRKIDQYVPVVKKASLQNELPFKFYAMMYDRYLSEHKKEQIYGTQIALIHLKNGKKDWYVWPIKNPKSVNRLRKRAGFDQTVEENAKNLGVDYSVIKLSQISL
jgi:hypothetical protein